VSEARYEPRFDLDYEYGRDGELMFGDVVRAIGRGELSVEVKRKRKPDGLFYVEFEQNPYDRGSWKPSGVRVSTADYWAFVVASTGVVLLVPRSRLVAAYRHHVGRVAEVTRGDNPTLGRLLSLADIVSAACDADQEPDLP
jgi:hypothetical protein